MWSMPRSCSRPAAAASRTSALAPPLSRTRCGAEQRHQDAVVEQRRSRLARQRQVQRDRLGQADRGDRVEQRLARARLRARRARRTASARSPRAPPPRATPPSTPGPGSMHSSSGSERRCETSRSYRLWSIVHAAFEQLDALRVVDRLRGLDRALGAELGDRLHEGRLRLAACSGATGVTLSLIAGKLTRAVAPSASRRRAQREICVNKAAGDAPASARPPARRALSTMRR